MCGIFGLVGNWSREELVTLAELAAERGPHGWGFSDAAGRIVGLGRFSSKKLTTFAPTPGAVVGHARLATSADRCETAALQPIRFEGFDLAHNGTVEHAALLQRTIGCEWKTGNDSEIIGRLFEEWERRFGYDWFVRFGLIDRILRAPYAIIVREGSSLMFQRRGHPLYATERAVCSRPFEDAEEIADSRLYLATENGRCEFVGHFDPIAAAPSLDQQARDEQ